MLMKEGKIQWISIPVHHVGKCSTNKSPLGITMTEG